MENRNGEVHVDSDEARGGSTPHIVRYILLISVVLVIVVLSITWITGALSTDELEEEATVSGKIDAMSDNGDTDSMVSDRIDGMEAAPGAE